MNGVDGYLIDFKILWAALCFFWRAIKPLPGKESSNHGLAKELFNEYLKLPKKIGVI